MKKIYFLILLSVITTLSGNTFSVVVDFEAGKKLFQNQCMSCHGAAAVRMAPPSLFGQESRYLQLALHAFKDNSRNDNIGFVMNSISGQLNEEQIINVTTYLTTRDVCDMDYNIDTDAPDFRERFQTGKNLAAEKNCMHCHGSFHHTAPKLYGQKLTYIQKSLLAFKDGSRSNQIMQRVASKLTRAQIKSLAMYFNTMILMRDCGSKKSI